MREIKFRIWDKQVKRFFYQLPEKHHLMWPRFDVQQFTGLKDKQGKKIYEGDILRGIKPWLVVWDERNFEFSLKKLDKAKESEYMRAHFSDFVGTRKNIEIIGNKWEHPELLKGE